MPNNDTPLLIRLHTPKGKFLKGTADIEVRHRTRGDRVVYRGEAALRDIPIPDLRRGPLEEYLITVTLGTGDVFAPQQQAVTIPYAGTVTLTFVFGEGAQAARAAVDSPPVLSPPFIPIDDDEPLPDLYFVTGTVASPGRAAIGGLRVVIVDKCIGGDVVLKIVLTNSAGRFSAEFEAAGIRQRGKRKPDLQARVHAGSTFLAASAVRYNAGELEVLDVLIPAAGADVLPSEYETLTAAIHLHYTQPLSRLEETDERQDVTYLANKTGWDARAVALASLADRATRAHPNPDGSFAIHPGFYYALFRAGLPADPQALYSTEIGVVERILRKSIEDGVIPKRLEQQLPRALDAYPRISAQVRLSGSPGIGVSPLHEMLDVSRLDAAEQQTFARLMVTHGQQPEVFWPAVREELGHEAARRLEVDGKLGFMTLNNAPLMRAVHSIEGTGGVRDPVRLAELGLHRPDAWQDLIQSVETIPAEIPGETAAEKRQNYSQYLAAQVRISYPTASVAEMVAPSIPVAARFLSEHQSDFVIGAQPIEQYVKRHDDLPVDDGVVRDIKRLQRLYQITPNDEALTALARNENIHSAFDIARQPRETFVAQHAADLGGIEAAQLTYDRAGEIYNNVLNIAAGFVQANNGFELGFGDVLNPVPTPPTGANADDLIAYPTLEKLFGSMDFCACDHCRSVLSPAAYLVDLLQFLDHPPNDGTSNPQEVLFDRRPDIQHLPLTCENTNVAMPYIDIVNETLEYFIANQVQQLSLRDYLGHDTDSSTSEDLLASPRFVMDDAYATLQETTFPPPLPFHRPLELLRASLETLDVPLPLAMERLRKGDKVTDNPYGWRDILNEELRISRTEYLILTSRVDVKLASLYGFPGGTSDADVIAAISNAKTFARRTGISYDELVALLRTRFVNPASDLLPRLRRLTVPVVAVTELTTTNDPARFARFDAALPAGGGTLDPVDFGGNIHDWATDQQNFARLMTLIVLSRLNPADDLCNFDLLELRRAKPAANEHDTSNRLDATAFFRLMRFIRLWRKTGWTMEQTDAALCALSNPDGRQLNDADVDTAGEVDNRLQTFLPRLAVIVRVMKALDLTASRDLLPLLACWSDIGTFGENSLYRQLFLNPAILAQDVREIEKREVFAADKHGDYLKDKGKDTALLASHAETVRAALNLTGAEYDEIVAALKLGGSAKLTLANVSRIFRYGYLARKLRISVRELQALIEVTKLDPFTQPDFAGAPLKPPAILELIDFVQSLRARGLKIADALYLVWNVDLSGKSAPDQAEIIELARTLRGDFADIESQFAAAEDPAGNIARARMALVYGDETAAAFFALLEDTIELDVAYTQLEPKLDDTITAFDALVYDSLRHRLGRKGLLPFSKRDDLKALAAATPAFRAAVDALYERGEDTKTSFFTRHPELQKLYDDYAIDPGTIEEKRSALLAAFQPGLSARRKRQQALQRLSASAKTELAFTRRILDGDAAPYPLHTSIGFRHPALEEVLSLESGPTLDYSDNSIDDNPDETFARAGLDASPVSRAPVSAVWRGWLEAPEDGYYNFFIEADLTAKVTLYLGAPRNLAQRNTTWRNADPIELKAGVLYKIVLTVDVVTDVVSVKWETPKRPREVIPARYLWSFDLLERFKRIYERFLKVSALAKALRLTVNEVAHFGTAAEHQIGHTGWFNRIPVRDQQFPPNESLGRSFRGLLDFVRIKQEVSAKDEQVLDALRNPDGAAAILHWDPASLTALRSHFGLPAANVGPLAAFSRIHDAFAVSRTAGVSPPALLAAVSNDPSADAVRDLHSALRARYAAEDWRTVVKPINDRLRDLQRDALVAYILHHFRGNAATRHIDRPERLFEYFLMDVAMEPCMQTSRIRHALSSVQLFVERCLMSLETHVSSASINAAQWAWMKRYRIWEANRKIFLYPENWIEPELRDDKTSFFKEIESELLQSDITEDSATEAVLNYLAKLEDIAKLEPCGICHTPEVDHIIARTAGANRRYFYRRRERRTWTPWEPIKADIEDSPVLPVVWNGRLLLFWLRVSQGTNNQRPSLSARGTVGALASAPIPDDQKVVIKVMLCWSEYYNGKWQAVKTSDPNSPLEFSSPLLGRDFVQLRASDTETSPLRIHVFDSSNPGGAFFLFNTHSAPEMGKAGGYFGAGKRLVLTNASASLATGGQDLPRAKDFSLSARYYGNTRDTDTQRMIIDPVFPVWPLEPRLPNAEREDPFLTSDRHHAFYVTARESLVPLWDIFSYGAMQTARVADNVTIPPIVTKPPELSIPPPAAWPQSGDIGVVDSKAISRLVTEDAYIRQGLATPGTIEFGGREIGPSGSMEKSGNGQ